MKEQSGGLVYNALRQHERHGAERQRQHGLGERDTRHGGSGSQHLDASRDDVRRIQLILYVNGTQVGSKAVAGTIVASNGALRIGGNNIWPEWFQGQIDEVRIYNKALTAAEVQADMTRRVSPDATAPVVASKTPSPAAIDVR